MENIFDMPILEQMFYFRKEDIDQTIYEKESEIRDIEDKVYEYNEKLIAVLKEVIPNKKDFEFNYDEPQWTTWDNLDYVIRDMIEEMKN